MRNSSPWSRQMCTCVDGTTPYHQQGQHHRYWELQTKEEPTIILRCTLSAAHAACKQGRSAHRKVGASLARKD